MKSHDAVEEDSRIEEELSLYASKVEAISFDTPVNEAKQSKVIEVLGAATFEQPSFKELPEVKSEDNSVVTESPGEEEVVTLPSFEASAEATSEAATDSIGEDELPLPFGASDEAKLEVTDSIGEEEVVPLPSFDASAEATSEAATDSIGEDDLPLPFGASDEAKLEVTDSIGEEEFPLPSFEAFGEANFEDADSFGEEDLSFDAFDEAKLDASDMEVGSLSLLDSDILLPLEAADLGAPMSSPGAQMLIGEIEEAVSQLSKEQIVVDTRRWMDFSCQVNTIESPTLNPVFSARCEDDSESESSSSSSEGEQNTLAENLLRTRRQNAQLKQLNEVVTKKNGVLVAQIEKQAAENFDLVCKYRACLQKLNEMLELEKKLGKRFEEEKLKMQHSYLEEQSNMAKQFELELERCKSDASVDSKSEMQEKFDSEITRLKDQHSLELENAVRDKSNELQEAFSRVKESALAEQKTQMSIDFEAMMRDNLDEQRLQLQEEFSNEILQMTQSFESEKAALEKSLSEKALEEMQTALANQEKDLKTQAEVELQSSLHSQMESLEGKFADQLERSLNEQKVTLSKLTSMIAQIEETKAKMPSQETVLADALEKQKKELVTEKYNALVSLQEKFDLEITRLKDQHSLEMEKAVRDKSNELQEAFSRVKESALAEQKTQMSIDFEAMMRDNLDEQKSQLLLSFESEKAALEQSLSEKAAQMESLEGNLGEQKSQLQEEFSNEIQRMTQSFESEKAALEKSLSEKALEEMQTALANQEKDLKTQAETQMESLEGKFADQLEQSLNEQKMTLSGLKSLEENFISVKENEMLELENKLSKKFEEEKMEMQRTYLDEQSKHVKVELERCVRDARSKMREKFDAEISQLKDELEKAVEEKSVAEAVLQSGQEQVAAAEVTVKKLSAAVQRLSTENAHLCSQLTSADEIAEKLDKVATVRVERVERQKKYEEKLEEIRLNLIKPKKKTKKKTKKPFV